MAHDAVVQIAYAEKIDDCRFDSERAVLVEAMTEDLNPNVGTTAFDLSDGGQLRQSRVDSAAVLRASAR